MSFDCHDPKPLDPDEKVEEESWGLLGRRNRQSELLFTRRCQKRLLVIVIMETALLIAMGAMLAYLLHRTSFQLPPNSVFSPVNHLIRYKNVVYSSGFEPHLSIYQGPPSAESDKAWSELYDYAVSRISRDEAAKLANHTVPIPGDPDHYAVSIDVFHQLHCLQMLRKRAWYAEGYEFDRRMLKIEHIDHCIDSIRQSLMCSADVTPLTWQWKEKDHQLDPVATVVHMCRDFDAIREWASQNAVRDFDTKQHVVPDI